MRMYGKATLVEAGRVGCGNKVTYRVGGPMPEDSQYTGNTITSMEVIMEGEVAHVRIKLDSRNTVEITLQGLPVEVTWTTCSTVSEGEMLRVILEALCVMGGLECAVISPRDRVVRRAGPVVMRPEQEGGENGTS